MGIISEDKIKLPIIVSGSYSAKGQKNPADALHSFERRKSDGFGGGMSTEINKKLKEVYQSGINPDIEDIEINIDSKNLFVSWSVKIVKNKNNKAYIGIQTFGSAGFDADRRAAEQKQEMMSRIENLVDYDLAKDFVNKNGIYIRQYFYKYTTTEFPPHGSGVFGKISSNLNEKKNENLDVINSLENLILDDVTLKKEDPPYSYNSDVENMQIALQFLGFSLPKWGVDGKFGPETKKALKDFQEEYMEDPTGEADPSSLKKIISQLKDKDFLSKDLSDIQRNKTDNYLDDDNQEKTSKDDIDKNEKKSNKNFKNIIIGDSTVPYLDNAIQKANRIDKKGGEDSLWLGGMSAIWLIGALKKYPVDKNVKNVIISIGTNGGFGKYLKYDVGELFEQLRKKFPNATYIVVQGAWGISTLKNIKDQDVKKYYQKYKNEGAIVIEPPIGRNEPHGNIPIYKKIANVIDGML